jgi:hypothetical protein
MLRSSAEHIWTSNYDDLFERANVVGYFGRRVVRNDLELLEGFRARNLVIKMNGDFQAAHFQEDLNWGLVFLQEQFDRADRDRPEIWRLFEDDYRQRSIIFVGVSFRDPVLRRILAVARQKVFRTRYNHYLITRKETEPAARAKQAMFAENLRRVSIIAVFKNSNQEIEDLVQRIALIAYKPIVGISGDAGRVRDEQDFGNVVPEGLSMTAGEIGRVCSGLGGELARKKLRVTSGCAPFVGIPFVEAAFAVDPASARFYLRKQGGTAYRRTAPAIVVPGGDYASMRARFIPELSTLIAIGGTPHNTEKSGTIQEIEMALERGIPVILLRGAGGEVQSHYEQLRARMERTYKDENLRRIVTDSNDEAAVVSGSDLAVFARERLPALIEKVLSVLMGAGTALQHGSHVREW